MFEQRFWLTSEPYRRDVGLTAANLRWLVVLANKAAPRRERMGTKKRAALLKGCSGKINVV